MRIRAKLISVYLGIALLFSLIGLYGVYYTSHVGELFEGVESDSVPSLTSLLDIIAATRQASIKAMEYSRRGRSVDREKALEALKKINEGMTSYKSTMLDQLPAQEQNLDAKISRFTQMIQSYLSLDSRSGMQDLIIDVDRLHEFRSYLIRTINEAIQNEPKELELILQNIKSEARKVSIKAVEFALHGVLKDMTKANQALSNLKEKINLYKKHSNVNVEFRQSVADKGDAYIRVSQKYLQDISAGEISVKDLHDKEMQVHEVRRDLIHSLYPLISYEKREFQEAAYETHSSITNAANILIISMVVVVLVSLASGFLVGRSITKPIEKLNEAAHQIANGNLNQEISIQSKDEVGKLARTFDHMRVNLKITYDYMEQLVEVRTTDLKAARDEAERANRIKSEFLSNMSHELRTPLNSIIGFSQLIEFETKEEETKQGVHEILESGNHLLGLINEILDLSKIESGKVMLSIQSYSLKKLLKNCLFTIKPVAAKASIEIVNNADVSSDVNIKVDEMRFKQVLLNLLSNAIKYNSDNGKVIVECFSNEDDSIRLSIADTGSGLTLDQQSHLFKSFERVGADQSNIEGTGLGLVISKRLIESMGGSIGVESEAGKGSRFWIQIPLA